MPVELTAEMIVEAAREHGIRLNGEGWLIPEEGCGCAAGVAYAIKNPEAWDCPCVTGSFPNFRGYSDGPEGSGLHDGFEDVNATLDRSILRNPDYKKHKLIGAEVRRLVHYTG